MNLDAAIVWRFLQENGRTTAHGIAERTELSLDRAHSALRLLAVIDKVCEEPHNSDIWRLT